MFNKSLVRNVIQSCIRIFSIVIVLAASTIVSAQTLQAVIDTSKGVVTVDLNE